MKKKKSCLIINSQTLNPQTYSAVYENEQNAHYVVATCSMEMTCALAKDLTEQGYDFIDLCGDFDQEKAEAIEAATQGRIKVSYAKYTPQEFARLENSPNLENYGFIWVCPGVESEPKRQTLPGEEFNTFIAYAADMEMACQVAMDMVNEGIHFIELCNWFYLERAEELAKFIGNKVPVGYCG